MNFYNTFKRRQETSLQAKEKILFISRLFKNQRQIGAIAPSSQKLAKMMSSEVILEHDQVVLELGGGTGSLTKGLIESGVPASKIWVVELDPKLVQHLKKRFPFVHVIQGDASHLKEILPVAIHGKVGTVISGLPLLNFSEDVQRSIVTSAFSVMPGKGCLVQFTYTPFSSLPAKKLGLSKRKIGVVLKNIPPATVWRYEKGPTYETQSNLFLTNTHVFDRGL